MAEAHPVYDGIKSKFDADAGAGGAKTLATGGGFSDSAPEDPHPPFVRWALLTDMPHQRLSSGDNVDAQIQFDVYADRGDGATAQAIDAAIRQLFDRQNITVAGFSRAHLMCVQRGQPFKEPGRYRVRSRYKMFGSAA